MPRQTSAIRSTAEVKSPAVRPESLIQKLQKNPQIPFAFVILISDAILVFLIINYVPYTKIDWDAYMSQISGFLGGERDYSKLEGDTGPLVYPAGFLYIYSAIKFLTGGEVYPAQILFGILYVVNLGLVLFIYLKTNVLPWWALFLISLSKRVHSIFVLRLFNDCFATTLLHAALVSFLYQKWHLGLIIFSGAVSVKMNVLLYAPPLLVLLLKAMDIFGVVSALAGAALVQIVLGLPFILSYPVAYISRAFNLGRIFVHFWSVNFKFVPESIFVSRGFAMFLLAAHLILLIIFGHYRWCRHEGGLSSLLHSRLVQQKLRTAYLSSFPLKQFNRTVKTLKAEHIVTTMFVGNFIGIVCARSLHYQFYSWYFHSLPYLLWRTTFPTWLRLILFITVELCWNIYPSNVYSSLLLLCAHLTILAGLWKASPAYPYMANERQREAKPESKAS
ncbi:dol-P-Man:Man(5)GlcNAc(2)-PP-Dol alpha-1,3-mannosyltransferase-like [Dorcoceras hygrometricum]|uniref:dolichyl-P-Man:Man5GlcNAc2-PP-dolichol alpha-1,3-mannosyltransferase n=1 Tax=Dorcoceras hygrometricum TaxID=472368 RepID=A0A2Z7BDQ2_9LAMI|nr:dol-P-Man:Man(5)GlcNAc(2)-PP-Dol alpha-1,3-mannosyltransferase-like [Dorcoceras hygrometricum]